MLVSSGCVTFLVSVRQTLAGRTRDVLCLVLRHTRAVNVVNNQSSLRNAISQEPMTNAVDPVASIARLKLTIAYFALRTITAHMTDSDAI